MCTPDVEEKRAPVRKPLQDHVNLAQGTAYFLGMFFIMYFHFVYCDYYYFFCGVGRWDIFFFVCVLRVFLGEPLFLLFCEEIFRILRFWQRDAARYEGKEEERKDASKQEGRKEESRKKERKKERKKHW